MAEPAPPTARNDAARRAAELLAPEHRAAGDEWPASGYLDLLEDELESTGTTQDLMTSRLVPVVYERWWRPALGRIAKGLTGPSMAEEVRVARLLMGLSPGQAVLDVASGPGNFSREFARTVGEPGLVVGLDASRTMLERGAVEMRSSGLGNLALVRGDATELPFVPESFDAACCFGALHLFAEPFTALDEMARVLRPGGRIALMTSVRRQITVPPLKPIFERTSGMRLFESDEVTGALAERGFVEIRQRLAGAVQFVGARLAGGAERSADSR